MIIKKSHSSTTSGPAKAVTRPEKLNKPKPFPKSVVSNNFDIITWLALWIEPIKNDINITLYKNLAFACATTDPWKTVAVN